MTVSTEISREEYTGNGVTTDFDYRFRVFSADELVVSVADTTENISTLVLNTDYTVTGSGSRTGGKVKLVNPLANAWRISIERDLPVTQETDVRNQGNFFPEVHEDAWDKLTMLIQQAFNGLSLALKKPTWLAKYYDAKGNRIINLGSPINSHDAANKTYVDSSVAGSIGHADDLFKRTIRVPENYVEQLPTVAGRRGRLFAWDNVGRPIAVHAETDDGTQLEIDLAGADGFKFVGQCPDFDTLRLIAPERAGQRILLSAFYNGETIGGGQFHAVQGLATDVPGQVAVVNQNWYWKRASSEVRLSDCGLKKSHRDNVTSQTGELYDVSDALQSAIDYALKNDMPLIWDSQDYANPGYQRYGYYVTKGIRLHKQVYVSSDYVCTGIKSQTGSMVLFVNSNNFTPIYTAAGPFALVNMSGNFNAEGKYYYGTLNTASNVENIMVRDFGGRANNLNGVLYMALGFNYKQITAFGFNGNGAHLFAYDGIAQDTRVERCGNETRFGLYSAPFPHADRADESNAITFLSLLAHDSYEKSWFVAGTKTNVLKVHDEALKCTVSSPSSTIGIENRNGYGYTSAYFSSIAGKLGTVSFATFSSESTVTPVLTLGVISSAMDNIGVGGARVSVIAGDPGPRGGFIGNITNIGGETRVVAGARATIGYSRSDTLLLLDSDSKVLRGAATTTQCAGVLEDFSTTSLSVLNNGVIRGGVCSSLSIQVTAASAEINGVRINGDVYVSSLNFRSYIKGCWIIGTLSAANNSVFDIDNCTTHILSLAGSSGLNVNIKGGVLDNAQISSGVFLSPVPSINFSLGGFVAPSGAGAIGRTTTDPNQGITYMCVGNSVWRKLTYS